MPNLGFFDGDLMAIYIKNFEIVSSHFVKIFDLIRKEKTDWEKELKRTGFRQDKDGYWHPPLEFSFGAPKLRDEGKVKLPPNPQDWHKIYQRQFFNEKGELEVFLKISFSEFIESYYDNYKFSTLPKIYPRLYLPKKGKVYVQVLNANIETIEDWLALPFKSVPFYSYGKITKPVKDFHIRQDMLREMADKYSSGKLTHQDVDLLEAYVNEKSWTDKLYEKEQLATKEPSEKEEVLTFTDWDGFWFWELLEDIKKKFPLNNCTLCRSYLNVSFKGHRDKKLCSQEENPECWKEQQRVKKRKQRASM